MDCVEKQMQQNISWNDVCDIQTDQPSQPAPKDAVLEHWDTYTSSAKGPSADSDLFKEHQFQIASEFSYITYKEPGANMKEKGTAVLRNLRSL